MTRLTSALPSVLGSILILAVLVGLLAVQLGGYQLLRQPAGSSTRLGPTETSIDAEGVALQPASVAEPQEPGCQRHLTMVDEAPITTELAASISSSIVIASVADEGPGRWRTDDNKAPAFRASGTDVMRLLRLAVRENLGQPVSQDVVVWVPGGSIGCDVYMVTGFQQDLARGDTYAFFLDANQSPTGGLKGVPRVLWIWPVEKTTVVTPNEGTVDLGTFEARAKR